MLARRSGLWRPPPVPGSRLSYRTPATTAGSIIEIHRRFCEQLPEEKIPRPRRRSWSSPESCAHRDVQVGQQCPQRARHAALMRNLFKARQDRDHHLDGGGSPPLAWRLVSHATLLDVLDTGPGDRICIRHRAFHLTRHRAHGVSLGLTTGAITRNSTGGSIHPPPAPVFGMVNVSAFSAPSPLANGSARQAPIFSVRR